ncbi:proton-conducting transporter transmembrane domain-containing protein [Geothrix fuzhouensis]|uniref:proton-conducting transporter transmembrane domain-containing protein n=1 Tax=Geothrix fuzhouensis TaxID=2966451 RepID=UPI0021489AF4|nr:proton-conducting transporter membrane subunit [Geothrix fuzhouensis]
MSLFLLALLAAAASGVPGLFLRRKGGEVAAGLLGLAAVLGLWASLRVLSGVPGGAVTLRTASLGAPGFLVLDPLAAFFAIPVLLLSVAGALYSLGYWEGRRGNTPALRLVYGLLTASLLMLVMASHALTFLLAWEGMAITAFLLVMAEDREPETRRAGWIYLVATHTGTLLLFAAFALLAKIHGHSGFAALPTGLAATRGGTALFALFLLGFGFKAGVLPLHFWLPPAHAAAPSHVSALMSGVMLKMGILGLVRFLSWVPDPPIWWGGALVALGALSGVLGVAFALGQHDLKRLLAYHSIENIGIILLGLGLGALGKSLGNPVMQTLGFAGALLHVVNHSLFKGLLFLSAGSVLHATGTRNLEQLGGLGQRMPWTSGAFLAGSWAICGLPPLNGFVSEWLIYLGAFRGLGPNLGPGRQGWPVVILLSLALIGALALACFAKAFGAVFLGLPRTGTAARAHEAPRTMLLPMGLLALACLAIGVAPILFAPALGRVADAMGPATGAALPALAGLPMISLVALVLGLLALLLWRWLRPMPRRDDRPTWDCGYAAPDARMQYTASSFADGLVRGLRWALRPAVHLPKVSGWFPRPTRYESHVPDPILDRAAAPALRFTVRGAALLRIAQGGALPVYLLYVLLTLLALLVWMVA